MSLVSLIFQTTFEIIFDLKISMVGKVMLQSWAIFILFNE